MDRSATASFPTFFGDHPFSPDLVLFKILSRIKKPRRRPQLFVGNGRNFSVLLSSVFPTAVGTDDDDIHESAGIDAFFYFKLNIPPCP